METWLNDFFFGVFPYIAIGVMIVGSLLRYDRDPFSWRADSSQFLRKKGMRWASNLFHVGILLLLAGHIVGLLTPSSIYTRFMTVQTKQMLAMVAGGVFGAVCFVGLSMLIYRRIFDPRIRKTTKPMDMFVLLILYAQLILGLASIPVSASHPDGSAMVALAHWAQYIATFRAGAADFVAGEHIIFKLHIILGLVIFLILPFTRLVHIFSAPVKYLVRPGFQIVRKRW